MCSSNTLYWYGCSHEWVARWVAVLTKHDDDVDDLIYGKQVNYFSVRVSFTYLCYYFRRLYFDAMRYDTMHYALVFALLDFSSNFIHSKTVTFISLTYVYWLQFVTGLFLICIEYSNYFGYFIIIESVLVEYHPNGPPIHDLNCDMTALPPKFYYNLYIQINIVFDHMFGLLCFYGFHQLIKNLKGLLIALL